MGLIEAVYSFAAEAHKGQQYGENDYFLYHICCVVEDLKRRYCGWGEDPIWCEKIICTAYLHDVIEDTGYTKVDVYNLLVEHTTEETAKEITHAVDVLTKREDVSYNDYIENVKTNKLASIVKEADAKFNMEECIAQGNYKWAKKYLKVLCTLNQK